MLDYKRNADSGGADLQWHYMLLICMQTHTHSTQGNHNTASILPRAFDMDIRFAKNRNRLHRIVYTYLAESNQSAQLAFREEI